MQEHEEDGVEDTQPHRRAHTSVVEADSTEVDVADKDSNVAMHMVVGYAYEPEVDDSLWQG